MFLCFFLKGWVSCDYNLAETVRIWQAFNYLLYFFRVCLRGQNANVKWTLHRIMALIHAPWPIHFLLLHIFDVCVLLAPLFVIEYQFRGKDSIIGEFSLEIDHFFVQIEHYNLSIAHRFDEIRPHSFENFILGHSLVLQLYKFFAQICQSALIAEIGGNVALQILNQQILLVVLRLIKFIIKLI